MSAQNDAPTVHVDALDDSPGLLAVKRFERARTRYRVLLTFTLATIFPILFGVLTGGLAEAALGFALGWCLSIVTLLARARMHRLFRGLVADRVIGKDVVVQTNPRGE